MCNKREDIRTRDIIKLRDSVVEGLKKELNDITFVSFEGSNFAAADIAVIDGQEKTQVYRVAVVKHKIGNENKDDKKTL